MNFTRQQFAAITNYDEFFELCKALSKLDSRSLYDCLLPIALEGARDGAHIIAARALIELQPRCPEDCAAVLRTISKSRWDLSLREVPFYLVAEFGKWRVLREVEQLAALGSLQKQERVLVEGVAYFASFPASELAKPFHYWEWEEVIEGRSASHAGNG